MLKSLQDVFIHLCANLIQVPGAKPHIWVDFMAGGGGGPPGDTLNTDDSGISSCQMCPLIPISPQLQSEPRYKQSFPVKCQRKQNILGHLGNICGI